MNNFAEEYESYKEIEARYDAAELAGDKEQIFLAKAQFRTLRGGLLAKGDAYFRTFELYRDAKDRGNDYIDFDEVIWDDNVFGLIEGLRSMGIEYFTFSSTWSSAVKTAWLFKENGCDLEGLVMIHSPHKRFFSKEYDKAPAYLFKVN